MLQRQESIIKDCPVLPLQLEDLKCQYLAAAMSQAGCAGLCAMPHCSPYAWGAQKCWHRSMELRPWWKHEIEPQPQDGKAPGLLPTKAPQLWAVGQTRGSHGQSGNWASHLAPLPSVMWSNKTAFQTPSSYCLTFILDWRLAKSLGSLDFSPFAELGCIPALWMLSCGYFLFTEIFISYQCFRQQRDGAQAQQSGLGPSLLPTAELWPGGSRLWALLHKNTEPWSCQHCLQPNFYTVCVYFCRLRKHKLGTKYLFHLAVNWDIFWFPLNPQ